MCANRAWVRGAMIAVTLTACSGSTAQIGGGDGGSSGGGGSGGGNGSSSGGSGGASSGGTTSPDQACSDLVTGLCSKLEACAPFAIVLSFGDINTCIARLKLACPSLFNSTGTGMNPSNAEACANAYATAACEDVLGNRSFDACVFPGSVAAGAGCGENSQCAADAYCNFSGGQPCGVCSPRLAGGATCSADGNCQSGLVCAKQNNAATGTCVAPGGQGAACDATHPCLATLGCSAAGACGPLLAAGAPCTVQNCDTLHGLYCNPQTHICAQITAAGPGSPCGYSMAAGSYSLCAASGRCVLASGAMAIGTCEATAKDGMSCDSTNGPPCISPAFCSGGVCSLPSSGCH
jgi:hypothetical protein